jgi:hypothetical protein
MSKEIKGLLGFIFAIIIGLFLFYGIYYGIDKLEKHKKKGILENISFVDGKIESKHSYKGLGVTVNYLINSKKYSTRIGVSSEFYNSVEVGSIVKIKYDSRSPARILLEE